MASMTTERKVRRVPAGGHTLSAGEESSHTPLPFEERYRKALSDGQLQRNGAGLSSYDASYLWLARRLGAELVTLDARLAAAASMR